MRNLPVLAERSRDYVEVETRPTVPISQSSAVSGSDGHSPYGLSFLWSETNAALIPPMRFGTYDRMRNEDGICRSTLWTYKLPIRRADWTLVPASEDPVDKAIAAAVDWNFGITKPGIMDLSFDEQLQQALLSLDYGAMFEELIWGDPQVWYDDDGDAHLLKPLARAAPRFPRTVRIPDGIKVNDRTGMIDYLIQNIPRTMPIPGDQLCWFTLDREGNDFFGRSLLRPMFGPWQLKQALFVSSGIGWDRYAFGTPVVRYPKGGGHERKREAERIGYDYRTHERGYIVLEGAVTDGWAVEIVGGQGALNDPTTLIRQYNDEMYSGALQHYLSLGRTGTGSRAVGDVQSEPFYMAAQAIGDTTATNFVRFKIRRFVDRNFGPQYDTPTLHVSKIASRNVQVLATAIAALTDAGLTFTDPDTQDALRDVLDLSALPEAIRAKLLQEMEQGDVGIAELPPPSNDTGLPLPAEALPPAPSRSVGPTAQTTMLPYVPAGGPLLAEDDPLYG